MKVMRLIRGSLSVLVLGLAACSTPVMMEPARSETPVLLEAPAATVVPEETEILEPDSPAVEREAAPTPTGAPTAEEGQSDPDAAIPEALLAAIRRVVAAQQGVPEGEVAVEHVEPAEWPDASLGCPQPGLMYAQVVTPGFLVELEAGGEEIVVHTDAGQRVVLCGEDGHPVVPAIPVDPDEILDGEPWIPVDG